MRTPRLVRPLAALILMVTLTLTGCADAGDGADPSPTPNETAAEEAAVDAGDLEGTYVSTSVQGHDLVEGTEVTMTFENDTMSVSAGCNSMFGAYAVDASGTLRWTGPPASTLIGCPDDLTAQDAWLTTLLTDGVVASRDGAALTLTSGDVVIVLSADSPVDLNTLLGRSWNLVGIIDGGVASPLHGRATRPFLSVRADGLARLSTGCNDGRTTVRVDGDQLVFGHAAITRRSCTGPARRVEQAMLAMVDQGRTDHVEVRDRVLIVRQGEQGLVFELDRPAG